MCPEILHFALAADCTGSINGPPRTKVSVIGLSSSLATVKQGIWRLQDETSPIRGGQCRFILYVKTLYYMFSRELCGTAHAAQGAQQSVPDPIRRQPAFSRW